MPKLRWEDLPAPVRQAIVSRTGPVWAARSASTGSVSDVAVALDTDSGPIFCKAIQVTNPLAHTHRTEARINPWLPGIAPRLRWTMEEAGWLALGFDQVSGRHPDLSPGSVDLPLIAETLTALPQRLTPCPPVWVQAATKRWEGWLDPSVVEGDSLMHTDVTPYNFLLSGARVHVVDWSAPCRGAAWIDTAMMIVRLVRAGHRPAQAESWADQIPAWKQAAPHKLDAFSSAIAALWERRVREIGAPHHGPLAAAARAWAAHRRSAA